MTHVWELLPDPFVVVTSQRHRWVSLVAQPTPVLLGAAILDFTTAHKIQDGSTQENQDGGSWLCQEEEVAGPCERRKFADRCNKVIGSYRGNIMV